MSFLSASENVGFSGIPQTISDASCATQYKMAVEAVPAVCSEINTFINDSSGDEHSYMNENYFHTKFKIDPNELYTFHDSDVIAGEITVSHTEDNFIFTDNIDSKALRLDSPKQDVDILSSLPNGTIKEEVKKDVVSNGHYKPMAKTTNRDVKTSNTKVLKVAKSHSHVKEPSRTNSSNVTKSTAHSPKSQSTTTASSTTPSGTKTSISSNNSTPTIPNVKNSGSETFLDVFKREQGLVDDNEAAAEIKIEPGLSLPPPAPVLVPAGKKIPSGKPASASKSRRGRGPTMHEALQRIPRRAQPVLNRAWHAPGEELFQCGPLDDTRLAFRLRDTSSSEDDDHIPNFGESMDCVEEGAADTRGARLALRRAALRRQVAQASNALRLSQGHRKERALANVIKKQVSGSAASPRLPTQTVNHLLAMRGLPDVLTSHERRLLRTTGWSGGDSVPTTKCAEDSCPQIALPCAEHCLAHVTKSNKQKLYASCSAVFAGGERCSQPLLPLHDHTPLCAEHAWKRDNYDKISQQVKPKKPIIRKRVWPPTPRRAKRRRRPPTKTRVPQTQINSNQSLSELNVCSNSSAYDSSEDTGIGGLSETEFIVTSAHELEVEQVPPDDILDSAVLGQIPDEAFTEFFNQAEGGATFAESSELARALEAVLDERALDSLTDSLPAHSLIPPRNKMQVSSVGVEMSSGVSS